MCGKWCAPRCEDRGELLDWLNFIGKCRHEIHNLWSYDDETAGNRAITELFDVCFERKRAEIIAERGRIDDTL